MYPGYYNPYTIPKSISLFSWLKRIKWSSLLDGTQKTLGVINQAIPIVNQVKPIMQNAKTMFRIVKEVNSNTDVKQPAKSIDTTTNIRNRGKFA